jgi:hypothetical protein
MQLEDIIFSEVSQVQTEKKPHVFSHVWKIDPDPKDKHIHENKWSYTNLCVCNSQLLRGRGKGKENVIASTILKYLTSMKVEDITIYTESCRIMEREEGRGKESNGRGWSDQSKVHWQQGYIEKSIWTLTWELITKDSIVN